MTKQEVERLARKLAEAEAELGAEGRRNVAALTPEEKLQARADFHIANSKMWAAKQAYDDAFRLWVSEAE